MVNQNDVKEMTKIYGIEQSAAIEALENTGNVEEALVWIFTDHETKPKKSKVMKEESSV